MSVTIYPVAPNGHPFPRREVSRPCQACAGDYCQPGWCEDGLETEQVPTVPECNFANANAALVLATIGIDPGPYNTGEIEPSEVSSILVECQRALGLDVTGMVRRAPMLRVEERGHGAQGCRYIVAASSDNDAQRRLESMRTVLQAAQDRGCGVAWS